MVSGGRSNAVHSVHIPLGHVLFLPVIEADQEHQEIPDLSAGQDVRAFADLRPFSLLGSKERLCSSAGQIPPPESLEEARVASDFDVGAPALQVRHSADDVLAPEEDVLLPELEDGP